MIVGIDVLWIKPTLGAFYCIIIKKMWYNSWEIDKWREPLQQFADLVFIRLLKLMAVVAMELGVIGCVITASASTACGNLKHGEANIKFDGNSVTMQKCSSGSLNTSAVSHCSSMFGATKTNVCDWAKARSGNQDVCNMPAPSDKKAVMVLYQYSTPDTSNRVIHMNLKPGYSWAMSSVNGAVCYVWFYQAVSKPSSTVASTVPQTSKSVAKTVSCDAGLFMVRSGNQCQCMSNYQWVDQNNHALGCKMTEEEVRKRECQEVGGARWDDAAKLCVCTDSNFEFDSQSKTCKELAGYALCLPLMANAEATWDDVNKVCNCTQKNYVLIDTKCVEHPDIVAERNAEMAKIAKSKIENVHSKLKRKQDSFKASAWKNAEGEFNTARLASDSIAGAAVGAVGGLLINKHVKKNQVEDGFEALGCSVRGEIVAGWGEEFSVGVKN